MSKPQHGAIAYVHAARALRPPDKESKLLLQYYVSNCGNGGTFFKSVLDTHMETLLSAAYIHKKNAEWKKIGLLDWVAGNSFKGRANTYTFNLANLNTGNDGIIVAWLTM